MQQTRLSLPWQPYILASWPQRSSGLNRLRCDKEHPKKFGRREISFL